MTVDFDKMRGLADAAKAALAALYEHRRKHSPTTEWHSRMRELNDYFVDQADPLLADVVPLVDEARQSRIDIVRATLALEALEPKVREIVGERAKLRSEQDARAALRVEFDKLKLIARVDVAEGESADSVAERIAAEMNKERADG